MDSYRAEIFGPVLQVLRVNTMQQAMQLIDDGFLLNEDLASILQRAATHWDYRISGDSADSDANRDEACTIAKMGKECGF